MTGSYDSVIGMKKEDSIASFLGEKCKKEPAKENLWIYGASTNKKNGQCESIKRFRLNESNSN